MDSIDPATRALVLEKIQIICDKPNGRSQLFRSGGHGYRSGIRHHFESSSEPAWFSVEPGSLDELSEIIKVIKAYRVPFAVKGGGHATNPKFSSTRGIQISMSRFNKISFNADNTQLTVGAGCVFDEIYKVIRPKKYNIVGGGGSVGIAGFMMGGGYSLKTNQYGLGIDNLVNVQMVLPDGVVVRADTGNNPDLFWAIKGGGNNFGIATEFVLKTHIQGTGQNGYVYGGLLTFKMNVVDRVKQAIIDFMNLRDTKAALVAAFRCYRSHDTEEIKFTVLAFYDDKKPTPDPFQPFLNIEHVGELKDSDYTIVEDAATLMYDYIPADDLASLFASAGDGYSPDAPYSFPSSAIAGMGVTNARARWGNVMVSHYTRPLIDDVQKEAEEAKKLMKDNKGRMVVADIWPFLPTMFDNSVDSAWPHEAGKPNGPLLLYFMWEDKKNDKAWIKQMKEALGRIRTVALQQGCTKDDPPNPVYCNTTLSDSDFTTPEQIYGRNMLQLSLLRAEFDRDNVMGLTGGFRIPRIWTP